MLCAFIIDIFILLLFVSNHHVSNMSRMNRSRGSSLSFSVSNCGRKKTQFFFIRLEKIWKTKIEKKRESEKTHQSFANNNNNSLDLGIEWVWGIYNKRLHDNEYG